MLPFVSLARPRVESLPRLLPEPFDCTGRISRGSVYVLLSRMKERELVDSRVERESTVAGMPRQLYVQSGTSRFVVVRYYSVYLHERTPCYRLGVVAPRASPAEGHCGSPSRVSSARYRGSVARCAYAGSPRI